jgi:hypothetical protein
VLLVKQPRAVVYSMQKFNLDSNARGGGGIRDKMFCVASTHCSKKNPKESPFVGHVENEPYDENPDRSCLNCGSSALLGETPKGVTAIRWRNLNGVFSVQ